MTADSMEAEVDQKNDKKHAWTDGKTATLLELVRESNINVLVVG